MHYLPLTPGLFSLLVASVPRADHPDPAPHPALRLYEARRRPGHGAPAVVRLADRQLFQHPDHDPARDSPCKVGEIVDFFGMRYVVPLVTSWPGTVLAVNVGGAVIPTLMSTYLVLRYQLWLKATIAVAVIAVIIHSMATPVHGVGIAVPVFAPVVATAILAFILSREYAAPLAYIGGSMGTLDRRRSAQSRQDRRPRRAGRLDRRRRHIRRHLPDRHPRRAARRHRLAIAPAPGLVGAPAKHAAASRASVATPATTNKKDEKR